MENNKNTEIKNSSEEEILNSIKKKKKSKFANFKAAFIMLMAFTLICGIIYPLSVTLVGQTLFPYEANGSVIEVTLKDGTKKVYGSEFIGQNYEDASYMFGRVNLGAPSNLSPEGEEMEKLLKERIEQRKEKLSAIGYVDEGDIPDELLTSGGSGVDPHISPDTAYFQVNAIISGRKNAGWKLLQDKDGNLTPMDKEDVASYVLKEGESFIDYTEDFIKDIIKKNTEGRFLGVFGEKRVNVLLVNLSLDGLI